jgi:predicted homoserine dehydrogenase-like protein
MNLFSLLKQREALGRPIRVGLIGAGKFGSMYLSQAPRTPGVHIVGVADLNVQRANDALKRVGWAKERYSATSLDEALAKGSTFICDDSEALIEHDEMDLVIEATGIPSAGIHHALQCCAHGRDIIMVNVEADALAGPLLAQRAAEAGIGYSAAYGDQPALTSELVDWARAAGFEVIAAGKGTKYLPVYHGSTPDTVWDHYGFFPEQVRQGDFNPQMFNSFLDGTKSALEMAVLANATGLSPPEDGLSFPPCGADDLPTVLKPIADGGVLPKRGMVEVVSSLERDGRPVHRDLRWGVYVTIAAPSDYVRRCFAEYGLKTDQSGVYAAMYKPYHLIGLELGISVASVALRREATGLTRSFCADAVATAKRNLVVGEQLDGEGGHTVYGKLVPAARSLASNALPVGLAHHTTVTRPVKAGSIVTWQDVATDESTQAVRVRREMEALFEEPARSGTRAPRGTG